MKLWDVLLTILLVSAVIEEYTILFFNTFIYYHKKPYVLYIELLFIIYYFELPIREVFYMIKLHHYIYKIYLAYFE